MRTGDLRQRITLQSNYRNRSASGVITDSWSDVATLWARIENATGRESFAGGQVNAENSHTITIRWLAGVTAEMRVAYVDQKGGGNTRYFDIRGVVNPDETRTMLMLSCLEVAGGQQRAVMG
jgi:SPP1 family predicted phage head-tail adaptor